MVATRRRAAACTVLAVWLAAAGCSVSALPATTVTTTVTPVVSVTAAVSRTAAVDGTLEATTGAAPTPPAGPPTGPATGPPTVTFAFAGDVNFAERTADRLADDPTSAFGVAAAELAKADLTMVNLETAITTRGAPEDKSFTFRAPPSALTALAAAGVDVATMANNHGADYGSVGLDDTLQAIVTSPLAVIGIGADQSQAYAPFTTTVNGLSIAVFAATQVHDHTLAYFTAGPDTPGVANATSDLLVQGVAAAAPMYDVVIVYLHWGTEYEQCPNGEQQSLADELAAAGATAVVGTHAHVLQGAGWRGDGVYVAYGLSNYLWWRSFGNDQDDNGVLTLTLQQHAVTAASFAPAHLDDTGVPVPAVGATKARIDEQWEDARSCSGLAAVPPS